MVAQNSTSPLLVGPQRMIAPIITYVETTVCTSSTVAIPCGHDGTVSTATQTLNSNQGVNVIIPSATIKGVNHMEEFNHPKTREAFRSTIEDGSNGTVFKK